MEALYTAFQVSRPLRGGLVLHSKSVSPSVEALYCNFYQSAPLRRLCTALSIIAEALYCSFYQSAPPWRLFTAISIGGPLRRVLRLLTPLWRLCTVLYTSRPLRGGFVQYYTFYQSAPPWRLVLHFLSVDPSVEALYYTFYQLAPLWRL